MYAYLGELTNALQRSLSVQAFNVDPSYPVFEVRMLSAGFDPAVDGLDRHVLYVCEYRQLRFLDPMLDFPPLVCVVERAVNADTVLLQRHQIVAVYGSTVVDVLVSLTNCIYETASRSSRVTELSLRLAECGTRSELMDCAYGLLRIPLVLTDVSQKITDFTPVDSVGSPIYRNIVSSGYLPVGSLTAGEENCHHQNVGAQTLSAGREELGIPPSVIINMTLNGRNMGHLHALCFNRPPTQEDRQLLQLLGNLLALDLANKPASRRQDPNQAGVFLRDILDNVAGTPDEIMDRQHRMKLPLRQFLYAAIVKTRSTDFSAHIDYIDLCQAFQQLLPGSYSCLFQDSVVILLNCRNEIFNMEEYLEPVRFLLGKHKLVVGVSNPFSAIHQLRQFGFQARKAIHLGSELDPERSVYCFSDYTLSYMAELALQANELETLCPPELTRLVIYCRENGDDLMETLRMYLICGRSKKNTAARMFIHVNTVKYRIAQIESICHVDLGDDTTALKLIMAFRLFEYREHFKNYTPMFGAQN